ncbi:MAG: hypothetical protein AB1777_12770, partial [Bacteroidota bacterium]
MLKQERGNLMGDTTADVSGDGTDTVTLKYDKVEDEVVLEADDGTISGDSNAFNVNLFAAPSITPSGSTNDSTPLINWTDVAGTGISYEMDLVKKTGDCSSISYDSPLASYDGENSQYQLAAGEALLDETAYCVRVISRDGYTNSVIAYEDFNLLTSKPATPTKVYIEESGLIATNGHPENTINIYNNENVSVKVYHADTLDGGKVFVKIKDGLGNETSEYDEDINAVNNTTISGIDASSLQQGTNLEIYARVEDAGTNSSDWATTTDSTGNPDDVTKDTSAPARPSLVEFQDDLINSSEDNATDLRVNGEAGTNIYYSISGGSTINNFSSPDTMEGDGSTDLSVDVSTLNDGTLTATVYLVDSSWNRSNSESDTTVKDTTAPNVALTYNPNRAVKDSDTMNITATFTEDVQDTPTIAVDYTDGSCADLGATAMVKTSATVWTYNIDVPACAVTTTATVTISGVDLAGNANNTATNNTFTVDNIAPTVNIITPLAANRVNSSTVVTFTGYESASPQCSINNTDWVTCTSGVTTLGGITGFNALGDGEFTLYLKDTDVAGNTGTDNEAGIVKDGTAPTILSVSSDLANGSYTVGQVVDIDVTFSESVTLAGGTLDVTLDTGDVIQIGAFGPVNSASGTYIVGAGDNSA